MRETFGIIAAGIGTAAFALLFGVPSRYYWNCGFIGSLSWLTYLLAAAIGAAPDVASFFAAVVAVTASRFCAVWYSCPATVFLISGLIPLVPGVGIYQTAYYLVTEQEMKALQSGIDALRAAVAIVLGMVLMLELPGRIFDPGRRE